MAVILFVHGGTPSADETAIINYLAGRGHTVDDLGAGASQPTSGYDVVIVSDSAGQATEDHYEAQAMGMIYNDSPWDVLTTASYAAFSGSAIDFQTAHEISNGLADPLTIRASADNFYGTPAANKMPDAVLIGVNASATSSALMLVMETGGTQNGGGTAPARRGGSALGLAFGSLNAAGQDLYARMVEWVADTGAAVSEGEATGTHSWAGQAVGTNRPATPTGLQATAVSASQVDLAWDAVTGASGYDIERDGVIIVTDHASTSYSDTGLDALTEYDYRVRAVGS